MGAADPSGPHAVGRHYDDYFTSWRPSALYVRWYLRHRRPIEYGHLLDALGEPAPRLLDVGCATGLPLADARRRGFGRDLLAGVDVSERLLAEARVRFERLDATGNRVVLELAAADELPFSDAAFDVVTCNGLVKYLDDDALHRSLSEMRRVCALGGRIAIGEFGPRATPRFSRLWRFSAIEDRELRDADVLEDAMRAAGFEEIRRVEIPRIRRFPYSYVGLVATAG